jgi:hypothetical protein
MLSTQPGSFILNLALPLVADIGNEPSADESIAEQLMLKLPPQPFGRRVSTRMLKSAQAAQKLADEVSAGDRPLRAFGEHSRLPAANATELAALKTLGGPEYGLYQLRFTQSPLAGNPADPVDTRCYADNSGAATYPRRGRGLSPYQAAKDWCHCSRTGRPTPPL